MRFKDNVGRFFNYWEIGQAKVFGRFNSSIQGALVFMTWLAVVGLELPVWIVGVIILCMIIFFVVSGFLYVRLGVYNLEINRVCVVNPFNKQVLERLNKIEKKLEDLSCLRKD